MLAETIYSASSKAATNQESRMASCHIQYQNRCLSHHARPLWSPPLVRDWLRLVSPCLSCACGVSFRSGTCATYGQGSNWSGHLWYGNRLWCTCKLSLKVKCFKGSQTSQFSSIFSHTFLENSPPSLVEWLPPASDRCCQCKDPNVARKLLG